MDIRPELLEMGMEEPRARAFSIFAPYAAESIADVIEAKSRFVHYTSAEVALSILTEKEIWMRRSTTMNDFSEIEYGTRLLREAFNSSAGLEFRALIDGLFPDCANKTAQQFDEWLPQFRAETYLTCLSAHRDTEDKLGRLSMWRAYGGSAGVALVLNQKPMTSVSDVLGAYSSPVAYFDQDRMQAEFNLIVRRVADNQEFLRAMGEQEVSNHLFGMFQSTVIGTKHPGFAEEQEWRVIHSPSFNPSTRLKHDIRTVRGVPQSIYRIPLENVPEEGLEGMAPSELIDRVIIGPTEHSYSVAEAFVRTLERLGVENAWQRVVLSDIPLRNTA